MMVEFVDGDHTGLRLNLSDSDIQSGSVEMVVPHADTCVSTSFGSSVSTGYRTHFVKYYIYEPVVQSGEYIATIYKRESNYFILSRDIFNILNDGDLDIGHDGEFHTFATYPLVIDEYAPVGTIIGNGPVCSTVVRQLEDMIKGDV